MAKRKEEIRKKKRIKEIRYDRERKTGRLKKKKRRQETRIVFIFLKLLCWKIYRHLPLTVK